MEDQKEKRGGNPLARINPLVRYALFSFIVTLIIAAVSTWSLDSVLEGGIPWAQQAAVPLLPDLRVTIWAVAIGAFLVLWGALLLLTRGVLGGAIRRGQEATSEQLAQRERERQEHEQLLVAEREQRQLAETLAGVALTLSESPDLGALLASICNESINMFQGDAAYLWLVDRDDLVGFAAQDEGREESIGLRFPLADPKLLGAQVIREHRPLVVNNAPDSHMVNPKLVQIFGIRSMLGIPLIKSGHPIGALMVLDTRDPQSFEPRDAETAAIFGNHALVAIENAQLNEKSQRRLRHQQALHEIDRAISSDAPLGSVLEVVLQQTIQELNVDAADILLLDPQTQTLKFQTGQGFRTYRIQHTHLTLEDEYAGRAVREGTSIPLDELEDAQPAFERYSMIAGENFMSYYVTPLIMKGQAKGVLEVFHRTPLRANEDWLEFFETLAGQAAIAIENAALLTDLLQTNADLREAYEAAIEGWGLALELRDRETQGHTLRVTEMTEKLARFMGVADEQLLHIRRGALLHDIGKLGIPDSTLLKQGKLTKQEEEIMRQHTQYAYDMLSRLPYLDEALDIPYSHHENWDGSGYPQGLKAEEIPLAARIFAVADVYDALTSDRPYRKAWSKEEALAYLKQRAGKQFDPLVVTHFLKLAGDGQLK